MGRRRSWLATLPVGALLAVFIGTPSSAAEADLTPRFVSTSSVNNQAADSTAADFQATTSIAVLPNTTVVAWADTAKPVGSNSLTGFGRSTNNGTSFSDLGSPVSDNSGPPVLAANFTSGNVYLATRASVGNVGVAKSTDGGQSFGPVVDATPGATSFGQWLAVDNSAGTSNGFVYVCANYIETSTLGLTRSTDSGATFTPNSGLTVAEGANFCSVIVGTDGKVHVFYQRSVGGGDHRIFQRTSIDRGLSLGPELEVADLILSGGFGRVQVGDGLFQAPHPQVAANPVSGALYVTFTDRDASTTDPSDAYFVSSNNGGVSWTPPVQIADDDAGRSQYAPTVAASPTGNRIMFGYYSRSSDPDQRVFHRRGRLGIVNTTTGAVTLRPSFQLGPNAPGQIPSVPAASAYDQIATDGTGRFHSVWADTRDGNGFHRNQSDIRYARINQDSSTVGLSVTLTNTPEADQLGANVTFTAKVTNSGTKPADDVYLNDVFPVGLVASSATGGDCHADGRFLGCALGTIAAGVTKTLTLKALATSAGSRTNQVSITTSDNDTSGANTASAGVQVGGSTTSFSASSVGTTAIPDEGSVDIPITVAPSKTVLDVRVRVRLAHETDADVSLSLISPYGVEVVLSTRNGLNGDDYGTGPNDCSGTPTEFRADAGTDIFEGSPPFPGAYRPEAPLSDFAGPDSDGVWKLRVADSFAGDTGTVGCVQIDIVHPK